MEVSFESSKLDNFSNESSMSGLLSSNAYDERLVELREDLLNEIYDIINGDYLTEHQKKILFMRLMGKTQNEIADHLGITQSAVHKAMHGNIDYRNNKAKEALSYAHDNFLFSSVVGEISKDLVMFYDNQSDPLSSL